MRVFCAVTSCNMPSVLDVNKAIEVAICPVVQYYHSRIAVGQCWTELNVIWQREKNSNYTSASA